MVDRVQIDEPLDISAVEIVVNGETVGFGWPGMAAAYDAMVERDETEEGD